MIALGDVIERCLRSFGITKDRVKAVTGKEDCGCQKRQEAMNQWGYSLQYRILAAWHRLAEWWHRLRHNRVIMRLRLSAWHIGAAWRVLFYGR